MQRRELFYDKSQSSYETEPTTASVSDVDDGSVRTYADALRAPDSARMLAARGFTAGDRLTVAGLLLFGRHPERQLPSAQVRVCRFTGVRREYEARQNLVSDARVEGPIPRLIGLAAGASGGRTRMTVAHVRTVAVIGASGDIGRGIVRAAVDRQWSVVLIARNAERLEALRAG